ncbi:MAG: M1 family aminopeptidase [Bacteroidales bacterium]
MQVNSRQVETRILIPALAGLMFILSLQAKAYYTPGQDTSGYNTRYLHLSLSASDTSAYLEGSAFYLLQPTRQSLHSLFLDFSNGYVVDSVLLNDHPGNFLHDGRGLTIEISPPAAEADLLSVEVFYHGRHQVNGDGITNGWDFTWEIPVTWTLSEPFSARNWFPVKQSLDDKIDSLDVTLHVPPGLKAGSNGVLERIDTLPDNSRVFHWKSRYPITYYLISFSIADYLDYSFHVFLAESGDSLLVQNYLYNRKDMPGAVKADVDKTAALINLYSELFGPYPFPAEKYGHCMAPIGGGMEHQTMTTLSSFGFNLVAHELAHMWFGDQVTCSSWNDIWLNEGFASYAEYLALENLVSKVKADEWMRNAQHAAMNVPQGSVFVPPDEDHLESRIFSSYLSYKKGAAIIHMIRYQLGNDELFFQVLRRYLELHAYGFSTAEDFLDVLENYSGKSFRNFFDEWYYGKGYPSLSLGWSQSSGVLHLALSEQTSSVSTPLFKFPLQLKIIFAKGDTIIEIPVDSNVVRLQIPLKRKIYSVQLDPDNWLLGNKTVYRIESSVPFIEVYPNPAGDYLTIAFRDDGHKRELNVINSAGSIVYTAFPSSSFHELNVSGWSSGSYLLRVIEEGRSYSVRVIKQ